MLKPVLTICLFWITASAFAQVDSNSALYKTILSKDSLLFEVGYNHCNISQFKTLLSEKFFFCHDQAGVSDKAKFLSDLQKGLCANPESRQVKRYLLKESTHIFPLYNNGVLYGAIQQGEHIFYETPQSTPGVARFTHLWQLENNEWKLTTSLSFDHKVYDPKKGN